MMVWNLRNVDFEESAKRKSHESNGLTSRAGGSLWTIITMTTTAGGFFPATWEVEQTHFRRPEIVHSPL
jgi:hypothetical protein